VPRTARAYAISDRLGYLALTVIVWSRDDAARAADLGCDPTRGPYSISPARMAEAREAIDYWQNNFSTDKAVDLTTNEGWDTL